MQAIRRLLGKWVNGPSAVEGKSIPGKSLKLETIVGNLDRGFIVCSGDGLVLMQNPAASEILGGEKMNKIDGLAKKFGEGFSLQEKFEECVSGKKVTRVREVVVGKRYIDLSLSPVVSGADVIKVVVLMDDITEERELAHLKDEFFVIASHELRTPLAAIRGNAELLERLYAGKLSDKNFDEIVDGIYDSAQRLIEIVNDFLDMVKLEQKKIEFKREKFDMLPVLKEVEVELGSVARKKEDIISVETDASLNVWGDRTRVKQVVVNLVGNAIKFTTKGKVCLGTKASGGVAQIWVRDTGGGISREHQDLLFKKFGQTNGDLSSSNGEKSTGLGLYICRLFVEGMGGKIYLESSRKGEGSKFVFELPCEVRD